MPLKLNDLSIIEVINIKSQAWTVGPHPLYPPSPLKGKGEVLEREAKPPLNSPIIIMILALVSYID